MATDDVFEWDWFIAHPGVHKEQARKLARALESLGLRVFLDEEQRRAGGDWGKQLERAQTRSRGTVVLWSKAALGTDHPWFADEVARATTLKQQGPHVVAPVLLDKTRLGYGLLAPEALWWDHRGPLGLAWELHGAVAERGVVPKPLGVAPEVAIVHAGGELAGVARKLSQELARSPDVGQTSVVDVSADGAEPVAELAIVLQGHGCGGPDGAARLGAWLDREVVLGVRITTQDEDLMIEHEDDLPLSLRLRKRCELKFQDEGEAVAQLRIAVLRWLEACLPRSQGAGGTLAGWEQRYLNGAQEQWCQGTASGLGDHGDHKPMNRAELYVSLRAMGGKWVLGEDGKVGAQEAEERSTKTLQGPVLRRGDREGSEPPPPYLDQVLSRPDGPLTLVSGEAGCGKTALLQHVAWSLALAHDPKRDLSPDCHLDLATLGADSPLPQPVPVFLVASRLARHLDPKAPGLALKHLLDALLAETAAPDTATLEEALHKGRLLLLVDSLDEVRTLPLRKAVVGALCACARAHPLTRIVLTSRPGAHTDVLFPVHFAAVDIAPLDPNQRDQLVGRWVAARHLDAELEQRLRTALTGLDRDFPRDEGSRSPLDNPLLLTVVLLVWLRTKELPDNLADLYKRMVAHLVDVAALKAGDKGEGPRRLRLKVLREVAWMLQVRCVTTLPLREVCRGLAAALDDFDGPDEAEGFVLQLGADTGLLQSYEERERGKRPRTMVRFWHRSFQEYLSMRRLAAEERPPAESLPAHRQWLLHPYWTGAWRYAVGAFGEERTDFERQYVDTVASLARLATVPGEEARLWGHVLTGLAEYQQAWFYEDARLVDLPREVAVLWAERAGEWPWAERRRVLDGLGRLEDPRLADPRETARDWVFFETWEGVVGEEETEEGAFQPLEPQLAQAGPLWVRRWPVTVAEWAAFMASDAAGEGLWDEAASVDRSPGRWLEQEPFGNRPVTDVSWWQARAFCRWARKSWALPEDAELVDLPTSVEWEAVARGDRGGPYPWGDQEPGREDVARANWSWEGWFSGRLDGVGSCPLGHVEGLWDLAGNVWEWTASEFEDDGAGTSIVDLSPPAAGLRVLRGGSWIYSNPRFLRCATRDCHGPGPRNVLVGFRLVCRVSPSRPS